MLSGKILVRVSSLYDVEVLIAESDSSPKNLGSTSGVDVCRQTALRKSCLEVLYGTQSFLICISTTKRVNEYGNWQLEAGFEGTTGKAHVRKREELGIAL